MAFGSGARSANRTTDARVVRTRNDIAQATLDVLIEHGWEAITHARIARAAGYSKATVYKYWATRTDLLRDAFVRLGDMPHHSPTGELRADLIAELTTFRSGMEHQRLDRALAALIGLTTSIPEMVEVRDTLVTDGERVVRNILASVFDGTELDAATLMLCGAVLHSALLHEELPGDEVIAAKVDIVLNGPTHTPAAVTIASVTKPASKPSNRP